MNESMCPLIEKRLIDAVGLIYFTKFVFYPNREIIIIITKKYQLI